MRFFEILLGGPWWWKVLLLIAVFTLAGGLIFRNYDMDLFHGRFTPVESDLVKNCRERTQTLLAGDQRASSDILALQAQVTAKERDLADTRQRCLVAMTSGKLGKDPRLTSGLGPGSSECSIPPDMLGYASGANEAYRMQMRELSDEIAAKVAQIAAIRDSQRQEHELVDKQCAGAGRL